MGTKNIYTLILKKIAKDSLDKIDKEQVDIYILGIKSILFFIGKSVLGIKYLKENKSISSEDIDVELIEKTYSIFLSRNFKEADKLFNDKILLNEELKINIVKVLKDIDKDELARFSLGELYETFITNKQEKLLGQVYTPEYIVKHMISLGITDEAIIENPYFSVVDPACGAGYFLLEAYDKIKQIFDENRTAIIQNYPKLEKEIKDGFHSFILKNNLTGFDIDPFAVYMTRVSLMLKGEIRDNLEINIFNKDIVVEKDYSLLDYLEEMILEDCSMGKYDLVIGNPPYIGHKSIDKDYRKILQDIYYDVYSDKADISYCFFKKGYQLLNKNGKLIFITSRYFLEAPSAKDLRKFLKNKYKIEEIIDFYGVNIFKGIGISPVIIKLLKIQSSKDNILVYRHKEGILPKKMNLELSRDFEKYYVSQEKLDDSGWLLASEEERQLFCKIEAQGEHLLDEVCLCNQGIITGCDKAFIVDIKTIERESLEKDICKPWVKNSEVRKFRNIQSKRFVLYTDLIDDLDEYKNTINHIAPYRNRLENRRECLAGTREWYKLQWGRDVGVFKQPKILFPYKASANEFTIEYGEMCCSADVYIISLRDNYINKISLEYLLAFLNSSLFEFYFKSVAKKLNEGMYEYYPNKLMTLKIKIGVEMESIENKVKKIMNLYYELGQTDTIEGNKESNCNVKYLEHEIEEEINYINNYFFRLYGLEKSEINIINKYV
ncbi:N-6 DNA methylase [Proteiniborus sp. MB09-C3]|uniref:Eco57I restriction-modification methylase domain-containing protein n=1 Tax=Proteiniborus sp. MB09-C3 TaxID=3050072 RepID=UPI002556ECDB|nr:N-6 DNA methylase [Proteiniborus sp. MB09-C3]WIV11355.1 N-6 DNA methylase [Proteiniborus sp. MB09-C3]